MIFKRTQKQEATTQEINKFIAESGVMMRRGRLSEAERLACEAVALARQSPSVPGVQAQCLINMIQVLLVSGKRQLGDYFDEAAKVIDKSSCAEALRCDLAIAKAEWHFIGGYSSPSKIVNELKALLPIVIRCKGRESLAAGSCFFLLGMGCEDMFRYEDAEMYLAQAVGTLGQVAGPRSVASLRSRIKLAEVRVKNQKITQAREDYAELARLHKIIGFSYPLSREMANLSTALGDSATAVQWLEEAALVLAASSHEKSSEHLSAVLAHLGILYLQSGRPSDAESVFRRQLAAGRSVQPADDVSIGIALNNIGVARREQGYLDEAALLGREALAMQEKAVGLDHPVLINTLKNIGIVEHRLGRHAEASVVFLRAITIAHARLSSEHPHCQQVMQCCLELGYHYGGLTNDTDADTQER